MAAVVTHPLVHVDDQHEINDDGRIDVCPASRLGQKVYQALHPSIAWSAAHLKALTRLQPAAPIDDSLPMLRLNIVIQVVGSRGDVQPFIALGNGLQACGHRVRIATHATFENFVKQSGLEFFAIGGDPEELMSYMVRNPGLIPGMKSLRAGDVATKRRMIADVLQGCWHSCIKPDKAGTPFIADAIIANPPSFAHLHCAEALAIPVHIMFTMPWSATKAFPHPLANIKKTTPEASSINHFSFSVVDWLTWSGLSDIINTWRQEIGLDMVTASEGPILAAALQIPHTYCWSPALVPKPTDWPDYINVCGFFFRDAPKYEPPEDLARFLATGPAPVYIGFGSIVLDDASKMSELILNAVTASGGRAIISHGWSHLSGPERPDVFWLGDCPHEWLFQHVSAVVHHGGAGTTACGLRNGRPTVIVPFFGDQGFWGQRVAVAGAGPQPIPHREPDSAKLAEAIKFCGTADVLAAAQKIAAQIKQEDGVAEAIKLFHRHLPLDKLRCEVLPDQASAWRVRVANKTVQMSSLAVETLLFSKAVKSWKIEKLNSDASIGMHVKDPVTGSVISAVDTSIGILDATIGVVRDPYKAYKKHEVMVSQVETSSDYRPRQGDVLKDRSREAGEMALASGRSLGRLATTYVKGTLSPKASEYYHDSEADEYKEYGTIDDVKSGGIVAGRSFFYGIGDGLHDLVMLPVEGGKSEGVLGVFKGVARGAGSMFTKTVAGSLGLVAYPAHGLVKSITTMLHQGVRQEIALAKRRDGQYRLAASGEDVSAKALAWYEDMLKAR